METENDGIHWSIDRAWMFVALTKSLSTVHSHYVYWNPCRTDHPHNKTV